MPTLRNASFGMILAAGAVFLSPAQAQQDGAFQWHAGMDVDYLSATREWYVSNFAIQRSDFRTAWKRKALRVEDGAMELLLRPAPDDLDKDFIGAEVQRRNKSHYGRYEVVMTAARGEGVISSFFTYTGAHFGDPHDEIDIEFLGRDTTKVWLNLIADGAQLPGQWIDLGFDAADGPHLYAFDWQPDSVVWYVDDREILRVDSADAALPITPAKLYINIWAGAEGQKNWSGVAPNDLPQGIYAKARYDCMSHQPAGMETPQCSDRPPVD